MSVHIHRNSFNAGELSPLMDARVDEAKYGFSCRIMENFVPKIYGGAFRRPGTMYLASQQALAEWVENTNVHRIFSADETAPTENDDTFYEVGSIWLQNVATLYKASSVSAGAASWGTVSGTHNLFAWVAPDQNASSSFGYSTSSLWYNQGTGALYKCSDDTPGAAVWARQTALNNLTATTAPGASDDTDDGYTTDSYWIHNVRTVHKCADNTEGAAVWNEITGTNNLVATRVPTGIDTGYSVGKVWIWQREDRAFELATLDHQEPVRFIDFNVSATTRYILAFGDGHVRIFNDDGSPFLDKINSPYNLPLELATPYRASEVFEVQIAQLGNLAYFAHPEHPPQKIERTFRPEFFSDFFTWSTVNWSFPAFRDTNITGVTASPSATSGSWSEISFTADPFTDSQTYSGYTGARIMLAQRRADSQRKLTLEATGSTTGMKVLGDYEVHTYGVFTGSLRVQAKNAAGTWVTLKSFQFSGEDGGRNIVYRASVETETELRLDATEDSDSTGGVAYLEAADSRHVGYARILNGIPYPSGLPVVPCAVELEFDSTAATTEWAIEAWAEYAGYPRAVCFHEQRLWFGGTELQPNTIWASATNDFENFRRGAFDSDSLAFTLAAQEGSAIQSLVSHDALVIFTQSEEWTAATSEQTAITPSNIFVRRQSRFGSTHKQAFVAANNLLFLQRGARKLRQFVYGGGGGEGQATDLSLLAEHVTASGIRQMAFQQQPDPIVWCVRNDGVLLSLTYEPDQNVIAWARHTSGSGLFESVAVIYGDEGDSDQVWFVVNRGGARTFERFDPDHFRKLDEGDSSRLVYVDSAVMGEGDGITTLSGLDHLDGETVAILAGGAVEPSQVVASGEIDIEGAADVIIAGLPYTSTLQPSKIELELPDGTAQGRRFLCKKATLNLWKSQGLQYAANPGDFTARSFNVLGRSTSTALNSPEPLYTGLVQINNMGSHDASVDLTIQQNLPLPANILALIPIIEVSKT